MKLKAVIVKPGLWGLKKGDIQTAGRFGIRCACYAWHRRYKAFHFQKFAFQKYRYKRRGHAYMLKKKREHPEADGRPLVFTGDSEEQAMANDKVKATATSEHFHGQAIISAPNLNYHADEMTRLTDGELVALQNEFASKFTAAWLVLAETKMATVPLAKLSAG